MRKIISLVAAVALAVLFALPASAGTDITSELRRLVDQHSAKNAGKMTDARWEVAVEEFRSRYEGERVDAKLVVQDVSCDNDSCEVNAYPYPSRDDFLPRIDVEGVDRD